MATAPFCLRLADATPPHACVVVNRPGRFAVYSADQWAALPEADRPAGANLLSNGCVMAPLAPHPGRERTPEYAAGDQPRPLATTVDYCRSKDFTVIYRTWADGDADRCWLCRTGCNARRLPDGNTVCTVIGSGEISRARAVLYRSFEPFPDRD